jgi:hypothetical protein
MYVIKKDWSHTCAMTLRDLFDMVYMKVGPQFHVPHHVQDGDCFRSIIIVEVIIKHINVI